MRKYIFSLLSLFCFFITQGQVMLSSEVQDALKKALKKDIELRNQKLEQEKMQLEYQGVRNKHLPKVEATVLYGYLNSKTNIDLPTLQLPITGLSLFSSSTNLAAEGQAFHGGITAKTILFSGNQINNGAKALQQKNQGTIYMMALRKNEVIEDLILSFDQIALLKTAERLIIESDKRLSKEGERVEKAISVGLAIPYDRDKIKLARLELETKKVDVEHKKELVALKINQLTGIPTEEILTIPHNVAPIIITEELDTENRNEIKALEAFREAASYAIKKEKGSLLPSVGAFGSYSYTSLFNINTKLPLSKNHNLHLRAHHLEFNPTWMLGLAMKWEIFSGFERKHKIESAQINASQIDNKLSDTKEKLALQLKKTKLEYETALERIKIAEQRAKIASNNNMLAQKQYKNGLISITERLGAENDLYQEALNKIETIIKQRQTAIETYQAAGLLEYFISQ